MSDRGMDPPSDSPRFYLGTHEPSWLARAGVPLFVSHRRLIKAPYRALRAAAPWVLDSGAFSEVYRWGRFRTTPAEYAAAATRYRDEIGRLEWAAPQDHMTEPWVMARSEIAKTVPAAQRWTLDNYLTLRTLSDLFVPVIQGQTLDDYRRHVDAYDAAGIDLRAAPIVGIGSVCRVQSTARIGATVAALAGDGLRLHGFGVKTEGIRRYGWCLTSADSMAWSYNGRRRRPCPHSGVSSCANCYDHAMAWRAGVIDHGRPVQLVMAV